MARRMPGDGSVYQRADGRWAATLEVPGGITRRRKTVYGRTQREALQRLAEARRNLEQGDHSTASLTVEKWLRYWLDEIAEPNVKPRTAATYRSYVEQHLIPALGRRRLDKLAPQQIREMHRAVEATGASATTVLHAHRILSTALTAAVRDGKVLRNVAELVPAPRRAPSTRKGLTAGHAKDVLRIAGRDDARLASRWLFAFLTGTRQGEALGLRWDRLDLDRGVADIAWTLQRIPYRHGCGDRSKSGWPCGRKGADRCPNRRLNVPRGLEHEVIDGNLALVRPKTKSSSRIIPLAEPLRLALIQRRAQYEQERAAYPVDHRLVWTRGAKDGRPLEPRRDYESWLALLDAAGAPRATLHETRHTTATLLLEAGLDAHVIAAMLGHSDVITTRGYQHVSDALTRAAADRLGGMLALDS